MAYWHTPRSIQYEQAKMQYTINCSRGVLLGETTEPVPVDATIVQGDLPASYQPVAAAFGDPDWVATAEQEINIII
jgi:hypothetical protein